MLFLAIRLSIKMQSVDYFLLQIKNKIKKKLIGDVT